MSDPEHGGKSRTAHLYQRARATPNARVRNLHRHHHYHYHYHHHYHYHLVTTTTTTHDLDNGTQDQSIQKKTVREDTNVQAIPLRPYPSRSPCATDPPPR